MPVTKEAEGTKTDVVEQEAKAKTSAEEVKAPEAEKVSAEEERIYSQKQVDELIHAAKSDAGRLRTVAETERDTLKSQIMTKENELGDIQAERDSLRKDIEDMSSDDPKKFDLVKRDRELRSEQSKLKSRLTELDDRENKLSEREKKVSSFEMEVLIESVADEYKDGDSAKLKKALSAFENPTEEQVKNIGAILFSEKSEGEKAEKLKPDSGKSRGGSTYFTRTQIADRKFWEANKDAILEAQAEGRIRNE